MEPMKTETPDTDTIDFLCNNVGDYEFRARYKSMLGHARKMEIQRDEAISRADRTKKYLEIEKSKCADLVDARNRAQHWEFVLSKWGASPETVSDFIHGQQARIELLSKSKP